MGRVDVRAWLMLAYALVWTVLMILLAVRTGEWPPAEAWATLGIGEGAILGLFRADEALRKKGEE
jgi:hypothetical protein